MVHDMFANAGAVRIDHILGLFRLWWIPEGKPATDGTYVHYDSDVMLGILALEASRAGGVVVGEDLGVVPAMCPSRCPNMAFSAVPGGNGSNRWTVCSALRRIGVRTHWRPSIRMTCLRRPVTSNMATSSCVSSSACCPVRWRKFQKSCNRPSTIAMLNMLVEEGYLDKAALDDEAANENEIVDALYRGLKGSPCKLMAASIVDAVGEKRTQNQPGTNNEYPNWRIPLADGEGNVVPLEKLFDEPRLQEITAIMRG